MSDDHDAIINERRTHGGAHMWTTQEIERLALRIHMEAIQSVREACRAERKEHEVAWRWVETSIKKEQAKNERWEKVRTSLYGQVLIWAFIGLGAAVWALFQSLIEKAKHGG